MTGPALLAVLLAASAGAMWPGGSGRPPRSPDRAGPDHTTVAVRDRWRARVRRVVGPRSRRLAEETLRAELDEMLGGLVGELRSGCDPRAALRAATAGLPALAPVAATAASPTADVPGALRSVATRRGGEVAGHLAVAWSVAERTGCGLAGPVSRLHSAARAEERLRRELAAQLAGPRATARLLTGLPVVGLAMGTALGADPVGFLLASVPGRACLLVGVLLVVAGSWWSRVILGSAGPGS